ncbi:hypothetical protein [Ruminococcus sp. Marseille-P6503]|uniref:hypothetical protein n=1 Tax=Ruminococcus sp. Marseille-P6503 TaxID=2364796 RepID=UPI000F51B920|nr:hypothetical protein [Ruminococcus sp. Marseille-P6503]
MKRYLPLVLDRLRNNVVLSVILCIQFLIMICCAAICFGELELTRLKHKMYEESNLSEFYYVAMTDDEEASEKIKKAVSESGAELMTFDTINGYDSFTNITFYSKSVFDSVDIHLSKGEMIDFDRDYNGSVPCLVSSEAAKKYKVGGTYTIENEYGAVGSFYVCGTVKNDLFLSETYSGFFYDTTMIIAYDKDNIINKTNNSLGHFEMINTQGIDGFEEKYSAFIDNLYFQPYDYFYQSFQKLEQEKIMPFVVLAVTFFGLSLTGLVSYGVVSARFTKRQNGIFCLCGAKTRTIAAISFMTVLALVMIPAVVSIPVILRIKTGTNIGETTLINANGYFLSVAICAAVLAVSAVVSVAQINRKRIIESVKDF